MVNVRRLFKANCGPGAVYLGSEVRQRGEHNVVAIQFEIVPEGRKFDMDGVLHHGETEDQQIENAVIRIAGLARQIRATLAAPDGAAMHVLKTPGRTQKPITLPKTPWDDKGDDDGGQRA